MSKKDLARGEGNRLADGQSVFDPNSDSHVERTTPLKTKMKRMLAAEDAGIDANREASTTRKRLSKDTKPI